MKVFAVYRNRSDYPGQFVVREWFVSMGGLMKAARAPLTVTDTLEEARAAIPGGLFRAPRCDVDDPAIFETWL